MTNISTHLTVYGLPRYFTEQYKLVKEARKLLLDYCSTISPEDFLQQNNAFGIASIRDLLVHIANCYRAWLGRALQEPVEFAVEEKITTIEEVRQLFRTIDELTEQFIDLIEKKKPTTLIIQKNGAEKQLTPLQLFSHVITHEFHHKGQVLSLSRHLGYLPADTDIIP